MPQLYPKRALYLVLACSAVFFYLFGESQDAYKLAMYMVQVLLSVLKQMDKRFPILSDTALTIGGLYISWKFVKFVFLLWYSLIVKTIKLVFFLTIALIAFAVYLRGVSILVNQDIPFLYQVFFQASNDKTENYGLFWGGVANTMSFVQQNAKRLWAINMLPGADPALNFQQRYGHILAPAKSYLMNQINTFQDSFRSFAIDEGAKPDAVDNFLSSLGRSSKYFGFN